MNLLRYIQIKADTGLPETTYGLSTGNRIDPADLDFNGYDSLPGGSKALLDDVWKGKLAEAIIFSDRTKELFYIKHSEKGYSTDGGKTGLTLQRIPLTSAVNNPLKAPSPSKNVPPKNDAPETIELHSMIGFILLLVFILVLCSIYLFWQVSSHSKQMTTMEATFESKIDGKLSGYITAENLNKKFSEYTTTTELNKKLESLDCITTENLNEQLSRYTTTTKLDKHLQLLGYIKAADLNEDALKKEEKSSPQSSTTIRPPNKGD